MLCYNEFENNLTIYRSRRFESKRTLITIAYWYIFQVIGQRVLIRLCPGVLA